MQQGTREARQGVEEKVVDNITSSSNKKLGSDMEVSQVKEGPA